METDPKPGRGRPPMPADEKASSHLHFKVTRRRKSAYVKAAKGESLAKWACGHLDKAAGYEGP